MNLPTVIVLLVVMALVIVAVHILRTGKGSCSCGEKKKSGCAGCTANCPLKGKI